MEEKGSKMAIGLFLRVYNLGLISHLRFLSLGVKLESVKK